MPYQRPPVRLGAFPDGEKGTEVILAEIIRVTKAAITDERVHQLARTIVAACPARNERCEAEALLAWMRQNFRYTRLPWHPDVVQRVQSPGYTLFDAPTRAGECASLSAALAALCMALGIEVRFRAAGSDAADPTRFEHVYVMVHVPDEGWLAADPSYAGGGIGWEHRDGRHFRDWEVT